MMRSSGNNNDAGLLVSGLDSVKSLSLISRLVEKGEAVTSGKVPKPSALKAAPSLIGKFGVFRSGLRTRTCFDDISMGTLATIT